MAFAAKHRVKLATLEWKLENMDDSESRVIFVVR